MGRRCLDAAAVLAVRTLAECVALTNHLNLIECREEVVYEFGVPLSTGAVAKDVLGLLGGHPGSLRSVARHCVVGIDYRQQSTVLGNLGPSQSVRVASAIHTFVMEEHSRQDVLQLL